MKKVVYFFVIVAFIAGPTLLFAALVPCDGPTCQACHLVELAQRILTWIISIMATIIAIVFVIGGLRMVMARGESGEISAARGMMTNSVVGFIILLAAWLIVDTVIKTFVDESKIGPWYKIECVAPPPPVATTPTTTLPPAVGTAAFSDAEARAQLSAAGITVNKTQAQGTSLEGMRQATIQDVIDLKNDCGCQVILTGGTESTGGHAGGAMSHETGYKYDVALNQKLDTFITTNYKKIGTRSDGAVMYSNPKDGSVYAKEGNHWDVLVPIQERPATNG